MTAVNRHFASFGRTILVVFTLLASYSAHSQTTYWSRATGVWSDVNTWSTTSSLGAAAAAVPVDGDFVIIERGFTVTVDGVVACETLQLGSVGAAAGTGAGLLTFSGVAPQLTVDGSISLGGNTAANDGTITFTVDAVVEADDLIFGGTLGQGLLIMTVGGKLRFVNGGITVAAGAGTWTPGIGEVIFTVNTILPASIFTSFHVLTIQGATVDLGVALTINALAGPPGPALNVINGTLAMGAFTLGSVDELNLTGGRITGAAALSLAGNVTTSASATVSSIEAPLALGAGRTFTVADDPATSPDLQITSVISGAFAIIKAGGGTMGISGTNTYSATTTVSDGVLQLGAANVIANTSAVTITNPGTLDLNGFSETVASIAGTGTITSAAAATLTSGGAGNTVFSGNIQNAVAITKTGAGSLTLSGTSNYTGATTVSVGTLIVGSTSALGAVTGGTTVTTGAVLDLNGVNYAAAEPLTLNGTGISFGGALINSGVAATFNGAITLGSSTTIVAAQAMNLGGSLSGAFDLTKGGAATVTFGSNPVSVTNLTISAGTLVSTSGTLTVTGNFSNSGTFTHNNGTVAFTGVAQSIGPGPFYNLTLSNSGPKTASANLTAVNSLDNGGGANNAIFLNMGVFTLSSPSIENTSATIQFAGAGVAVATGTVEYTGSFQSVAAGTYNHLKISQASGDALLTGATTAQNVLTLSTGRLVLGANDLVVGVGSVTVAAPSATKMIVASGGGSLTLTYTGAGTYLFPIGDNSGVTEYSPLSVTFGSALPGTITASVVDAKHPSNASTTNYLTRYWNISQTGLSGAATLAGTYTAADVVGTEANVRSAHLNGTFNVTTNPWVLYTAPAPPVVTAAGITTISTGSAFTGINGTAPTVSIDQGATASLCNGSSLQLTITATGNAPLTYAWTVAGAGAISATTISNPIVSPTADETYTITVTDGNGITVTDNIDITVIPVPTLASVTQSAVVCDGSGAVIDLTGLVAGTTSTIAYTINGVAASAAGIVADGSGEGSFTTAILAASNDGQALVVTGITITNVAPNCSALFSESVLLDVDLPAAITVQPTLVSACETSTVQFSVTTVGTDVTYQWEVDDGGGFDPVVDGGIYGGATTSTLTLTGILLGMNGYDYHVIIDNGAGSTCVGVPIPSNDVELTVKEIPAVSASSVSICNGQTTNIAITDPNSVAGVSFAWTIQSSTNVTGASAGSGVLINQAITSTNATGPGTVVYSIVPSAAGCVGNAFAVTAIVQPAPSFTATNSATQICSGSQTDITLNTTITGGQVRLKTVTYGAVTGTLAAGLLYSDGQKITETLLNTTDAPVTVQYVFEAIVGSCGPSATLTRNVLVNPNPSFTVTNNAPSICSGDDTDIVFASATTGHQINVVSVAYGAVTGGAIVAGTDIFADTDVLAETLSNATTAPISVVYEFNVTTPGTTPECPLVPVSQFVTVVVEPNPVLTSGLTIADICSGSVVSYTPTSSTAGATFSWSRATVAGISPTGPTTGTGTVNETLSNSNTGPTTVTYVYTVSANGCTNATTYDVDVLVNPNPSFAVTNNAPSICSGDDTDIVFASATTGHQINVVSVAYGAVTGGAIVAGTDIFADTDVLAETLSNATTAPISVVYEFNVTTPGTTPECPLVPVSQFVTVVVEPNPVLTSGLTIADICSGSVVSYTPTSSTAGATFSWSRATVAGISPTGPTTGTGTVNETLSNSNTGPTTVTYVYTVSANGCTNATTYDVDVVVNPNPSFTVTNNAPSICSGDDTDIVFASATTGHQINVVSVAYGAVTGGAIVAGTDIFADTDVLAETLSNATTAPISVVYEFNVTTPGTTPECPLVPVSQFVTVVVEPNPVLTSGLTIADICSGSVVSYTPTSSTAGATFSWSRATVAGISPTGPTTGTGTVNETLSNSNTGPTTVTYVYTVSANGCTNATTYDVDVVVNPNPSFTVTNNAPSICSGDDTDIVFASATTGHQINVVSVAYGAVTGGAIVAGTDIFADTDVLAETLSNATTAPISVVYEFNVTTPGTTPECPLVPVSQFVTVVVEPNPVLTSGLTIADICSGSVVSYTPTSSTAGATFSWSRATVAGISPTGPTTGTGTVNETLSSSNNGPTTVTYVYTVSANGCTNATTYDVDVVVNPNPSFTVTNNAPSICSGDDTDIVFASATTGHQINVLSVAYGAVTGGAIVAGTDIFADTDVLAETLSNATTAPISVVYEFNVTTPGTTPECPLVPVSQFVTVVVEPNPVLTSGLTIADICSGSVVSYSPTSSTAGATFSWSRATVAGISPTGPTTGTGTVNETLSNSNTGPTTVTYVYTVSANGCTNATTYDVDVLVNPNPSFTVTNNAPSICSGDDTDIVFASATTGHQINVVSVAYGAVTGGAIVAGTDIFADTDVLAETLSNATTAPISVVYEFNVTTPGTTPECPLVPVSQFVTVVVEPNPVLTSGLTIADICSGSVVSYTPTSSTAGATFSWSRATVAGISPTGPTTGTGTVNETLSNSNTGPTTVTYVYTVSANGCTNATTYDVDVVVNPNPSFTVTNNAPSICSGDDTDIVFASATTGHQINVVSVAYGAVTGGAIVAGTDIFADTDVLAETLSNATTAPISVVYEFNVTTPGTTPECPLVPVSQFVTVVVEPNPVLTSGLTIADICSGSVVSYTPTSSTAGATFSWSRATVAGISPTGPTTGTGTVNETLSNSNTGPTTVTYVYTVSANGCTNATTYDVDVVVNPNPSFTVTNNAPSICSGDDTDIVFASATTGHQINVVSVAYGAVTGGAIVAGTDIFADTDVLAETLSNATTAPISVVYEFNVTTPGTTPECPLVPVSQFVTVVVEPNPVLTSGLTIADICSGSVVSYTPTSSTAGATFSWSRATVAGISPTGPTTGTGTVNETLSNSNTGPTTVTYVYTVSANGCTNATTYDVDVVVNPNPSFTVTNNAPSICSGDDTDIVFASATTGHQINVVSVAYGAVTGGAIVAGTDIFADTDVLAETLSNATTAPISVVYEFNVTTPGTTPECPLVPVSQFVTVVVEPNPVLTSGLTIADICSGSVVSYTPTSSTAGATFSWSRATVAGISPTGPTTGTGTVNETLSNSNTGPTTVTYVYTVSANGCTNATTYDVDVVVNPNPSFTVTNNAPSICSGDDTDIVFASATTGHQINVVSVAYGAVTGGAIVAGTDIFADTDVLAETLSNATTAPISVVYEFNVTTPGTTPECPLVPVSQFVTVVVEPNPVLTSGLTIADICSGSVVSYTPTSSTAGATFSWSRATVAGISPTGPTTGTGTVNETLSNSNTGPTTVTYVYTVSANGCTNATTYDVDVVVNPNPSFTVTNNAPSICSGDDTDIVFASATTGHQINVVSVAYGAVTGGAIVAGTDIFADTDVLAETLSNATTAPISVVYEFNVTTPGTTPECPLVPVSQFVTVVVEPNPVLTSGLTIADICSGSVVSYTPTSSTAGATFSWSRATVVGISPTGPTTGTGTVNETLSSSNTSNTPVTYVYTVSANGCTNPTTYNVTVVVNPVPVITNTATQLQAEICSGVALNFTPTSSIAGTTYAWTSLIAGPINAATVTAAGGGAITNSPQNTGNVDGTVTYTITPSGPGGALGTCAGVARNYVVTVHPVPTVTAPDQTICSGQSSSVAILDTPTSVAGTTFTWTVVGVNVTGASAGSGASISQLLTSTNGTTNGTATYTITASANGCSGPTTDVSIVTVNPVPVITNTATQLQASICSGVALNFTPTSSIAGTTYAWTSLIAGPINAATVTAAGGGAITNSPQNTGNVDGTVTYTITPSGPGGALGTCAGVARNYVVTVHPVPTVTAPDQTICSGQSSSVAILSTPTSVAGTTFTWTVVGVNVTGASAGSGASISQLLTSTNGTTNGTATYTITASANGCSGPTTDVSIVTVNPVPVITNTATQLQASICSGVALNFTPTSSIGGTTYAWTSLIAGPINAATVTAAGSGAITNSPQNTGNVDGTVTYTITPSGPGGALGTCAGVARNYVVTVHPVPTVTAPDQTICSGQSSSVAILDTPTSVAGTTFTWTVVGVNVTGASAGSGASISQLLTSTNGTTNGTATYTITASANGCSGPTTDVSIVTVNPVPVITNTATQLQAEICSGVALNFTPTSSIGGTTYAWTSLIAGPINAATVTAAGGGAITNSPQNTGNVDGTVTYTITPSGPGGALGTCAGASRNYVVTVHPVPTVTAPDQTICSGQSSSVAILSTPTSVAGTTFTWTVVGVNVTGASAGSGASISQLLTSTNGTTNGTATYTITASANGCSGPTTDVSLVTVNPVPVITNTATQLQAEICSGVALNFTPTSSIAGTTYAWTSLIAGPINAATVTAAGSGAITNSPQNTGNVDGTVTYTITPSGPGGALGTCAGTSRNYVVTVHPVPTVTAGNQTICSGQSSSVAILSTPTSVAGTTFTWTVVGVNVTGASAGSGAVISQALTSTNGTTNGTATYTITASANGCSGPTTDVSLVTVNPVPVITNTATQLQAEICSGVALNFTPTSSIAGTTYAWTSLIAGPINAATVTAAGGGAITNSPQNTGNVDGTVTYTITPSGPGGALGTCAGVARNYVVTVHPVPTVTAANQTICSGQSSSITILSTPNSVAGTTFTWTVVGVNVTGATAGSGASISQLLTSTNGTTNGTATYTITASANGCSGPTTDVSLVTVNPVPVITNTATQLQAEICSGVALNFTPTSSIAGTTYAWTSLIAGPINAATVTAAGSGAITNSPQNTGNVDGTVTYTITPSGPGGVLGTCAGASRNYVVTIHPVPTVTAPDQTICSGQSSSVAILDTPTSVAGTTFTWTVVGVNVTGATAGSGASISQLLTSTNGTTNGTATYTITASANGCSGPTTDVSLVTVNPVPVITNTATQLQAEICSGVALNFTPTSSIAGTTYAWTSLIAGPINAATVTAAGSGAITNSPQNTGNVDGTVTYTITPSGPGGALGTCAGASRNYVVTVHPVPTVTAPDQTICSGQSSSVAILDTPNSVAGTTFTWTVVGVNVTGASAGSGSVISQALTSTNGTTTGTATYTITASANGCSGPTTDVSLVTVNPVPASSISLAPSDICSGDLFSYTPTSSTPAMTYTWSRATVAGITPAGPTNGNNVLISETLINTTTTPLVVTYKVIMTANGCTNGPTGQNVVLTVNPNPVLSSTLAPADICSGTTFSYTPTSATVGASFTWVRTPVTGITSTGPASGPAGVNAVLTNSTALPINVTYVYTTLANGCSVDQDVIVTVNPIPVLTSANTIATLCSGSLVAYTPLSSTPGATFTWTRAGNASISPAGAGSGIGAISETLENISTANVTVNYTYTVSANGCTNVTTFLVTVVVKPIPVLNTTLTPADICSGDTFTYIPGSATATSTFAWSRAVVAGITESASSGTGSIGEVLSNTTTTPLDVAYKIITTAASCTNGPAGQFVVVTVNPNPVLTSTLAPADICSGTTFSYTPTSATVGSTFTWVRTPITGITSTGPASGPAGVNAILTNSTALPIDVTYVYTTLANGCSVDQDVIVTVNPIPVLTSANTIAAICSGSLVSYTPLSSTTGATFTWTRAFQTIITPAGPLAGSGSISETLNNTGNVPMTVVYKYTVTGNSCTNPTVFNVSVVVNPNPTFTATNSAPLICSGADTNILFDSPTSGHSINLVSVDYGNATGGTLTAGVSTFTDGVLLAETLSNSTTTFTDVTYVFNVTTPGTTPSCPLVPVSQTVVVRVEPTSTFTVTNGATRFCSGNQTNILLNTTIVGAQIRLESVNYGAVSGTLSAGALYTNGQVIGEVLANATNAPVTVTYTFEAVVGACGPSAQQIATVIVDPIPSLATNLTTQELCEGQLSTVVLSNPNAVSGTQYIWTVVETGLTGANNQPTPTVASAVNTPLTLTTTGPLGTVNYTIRSIANGCQSVPENVLLTLRRQALVSVPIPTTLCEPSAIPLNGTVSGGATIGTWSIVPGFGFGTLSATNVVPGSPIQANSSYAVDQNDIAGSVTMRLTTNDPDGPSGLCQVASADYTIVINRSARADAGPDLEQCADLPSIQLQGSSLYSPLGVLWTKVVGAGAFSDDTSVTSSYAFANPSEINQTLTLKLTALDPDGTGASGPCPEVSDEMTVKVNPLPVVSFVGIPTPAQIPENRDPIPMTGNQLGGLFTISPTTSIIGATLQNPTDEAMFDPDLASLGVNTITYTYTDINGCTDVDSQDIRVDPVTEVKFVIDNATITATGEWLLCANQGLVLLTGDPHHSTGFGANTRFHPDPFAPDGELYHNTIDIQLVNGEYYIDTDGLVSDTYYIRYTYVNEFGGETFKNSPVRILAAPTSIIEVANSCIKDAINFTDASTMSPTPFPASIISWRWDFDDQSFTNVQNPSHGYIVPDFYDIELTAISDQGCSDTTVLRIRVGDVPTVDFKWSAICNNESTNFVNLSSSTFSLIDNYTWDFQDGTVISGPPGVSVTGAPGTTGTYDNPSHAFSVFGKYDINLQIHTDDGCDNSLEQEVFILQYNTVNVDINQTYDEDFQAGAGAWIPESLWKEKGGPSANVKDSVRYSWEWGNMSTAKNIVPASPGDNAWWTGRRLTVDPYGNSNPRYENPDTYFTSETSAVNGPCFNLSGLSRPMVMLDYWSDSEEDRDGAVLQYSINGGDTWQIVGQLAQGIDWYNSSGIIGKPGNQVFGDGWSGKGGAWVTARFNLDAIPYSERDQVRLRVAFGSEDVNDTQNTYDGFAFDNFFVGEKTRNVLIENFTNVYPASNSSDSYIQNLFNNQVINLRPETGAADFHVINYHLNQPRVDPLNRDNPVDPGARALYMKVSYTPYTIIDGNPRKKFTGGFQELNQIEIDRRSLEDPQFLIELDSVTLNPALVPNSNNKINPVLKVTAKQSFTGVLLINVALVEDHVGPYRNVLRKLLFGPDGLTITNSWTADAFNTYDEGPITIDVPITNPDSLTMIAWVQDKITQEIYQSAVLKAPNKVGGVSVGVVEDEDIPTALSGIRIFPNPADNQFSFFLPGDTNEGFEWRLSDQRGIVVASGSFDDAFDHKLDVDISSLSNGVYIVMIAGPDNTVTYEKLVIMNHR